jgi:DNA-binding SARP family transcriptional activator
MTRAAILISRCAVAVVALAVLSQMRPELADLPPSLDAPLTIGAVEQTVLLVLWAAAAALAIGLLARTIAAALSRTPKRRAPTLALDRHGPRRHRVPATTAPQPSPAFTVAVRAIREQPPITAGAPEPTTPQTTPRQIAARAGAVVTISVLGPVEIGGVDQPKRTATRELIAYLALNGASTRDQLLEALWPGKDPRRTRPRLWQSVSEAGRILGEAFVRTRDRYRLDPERVQLDTDELDRLISRADEANDPDIERDALEAALALWRGDPLAGADYHWADGTIRHLQAVQLDLLERVAYARLDAGDATAALEAAERGIASEELHEGLWRVALQAESDIGRREAITQRYDTLRDRLDNQLGLQPESDTTRLYRRLLAQS